MRPWPSGRAPGSAAGPRAEGPRAAYRASVPGAGGIFAGWMGRRRTKNGLIKKKSKNGTAIRTREVKLNSCTSVTNRTKNTAPAMAATAASGIKRFIQRDVRAFAAFPAAVFPLCFQSPCAEPVDLFPAVQAFWKHESHDVPLLLFQTLEISSMYPVRFNSVDEEIWEI